MIFGCAGLWRTLLLILFYINFQRKQTLNLMAGNVNITSKGIQKVLKHYTPRQAIAEYIWNGFDAGADTIHINYGFNELGNMEHLVISDNGNGIDMEKIKAKFNP